VRLRVVQRIRLELALGVEQEGQRVRAAHGVTSRASRSRRRARNSSVAT
jgi:hypothetical protein